MIAVVNDGGKVKGNHSLEDTFFFLYRFLQVFNLIGLMVILHSKCLKNYVIAQKKHLQDKNKA